MRVVAQRTGRYSFGSGDASRDYVLHVPDELPPAAPVLVMLHGGGHGAEEFAAGTRMSDLADQHGFIVVYPEQSRAANQAGFWNWFRPQDQQRGAGEPALLAGITAEVLERCAADPARVAVAGMSAGGAMAAVLAAGYPEIFSRIGVHSGLGYRSAHDIGSALDAMRRGGSDPVHGVPVPLIVFHGSNDHTVSPINADQLVSATLSAADRQGGSMYEITKATEPRDGLHGYSCTEYRDADGLVVESWRVHGGGHAWFGGAPWVSFTDPLGPDASAELVRFLMDR